METKVLVYKTKQTIKEETYYSCSDEVYNELKNAKTKKEKMDIWNKFNVWDSEIIEENIDNSTEVEVDCQIVDYDYGRDDEWQLHAESNGYV